VHLSTHKSATELADEHIEGMEWGLRKADRHYVRVGLQCGVAPEKAKKPKQQTAKQTVRERQESVKNSRAQVVAALKACHGETTYSTQTYDRLGDPCSTTQRAALESLPPELEDATGAATANFKIPHPKNSTNDIEAIILEGVVAVGGARVEFTAFRRAIHTITEPQS